MANELPPIPEGFELESPATGSQGSLPPIPEGFEIEEEGPLTTARREAFGVLRGMREGLPFAKDISAATYAAQSALQGRGWDYAKERERVSRQQKAASEATPLAYTAGEIGSFFTPLGLPGKAPSLANLALRGEQAVAKKLAPKIGESAAKIAGAGAAGAGLGALQGAGEGEDLSSRLENIGYGAIGGGALGAAFPVAGKALGLAPTVAEKAARRLGINIPASIASENKLLRPFITGLSASPVTQGIMEGGTRRGLSHLERTLENVPGITKPRLTPSEAGESAAQSLRDWVTTDSRNDVNARYNYLKRLINPKINTPLTNTKAVVDRIGAERLNAKLGDSSAAKIVLDAVNDPAGLNYDGMQRLKQEVGSKLKGVITQSDLNQNELEALYNGMRADVRNSALNAGGESGLAAFDRANDYAKAIIDTRERLGKIIGVKGDVGDEAVFGRLSNLAQSGNSANVKLLQTAKNSMSPQSWNDVSSGIINNLGKTPTGFSPDVLIKNLGKMPDESKDAVFGPVGTSVRDAIEDISTVAQRYAEVGKTKNFSNTALALGAMSLPPALLGLITGGPSGALETEAKAAVATVPLAIILAQPRLAPLAVRYLMNPSKETISNLRNSVVSFARQRLSTPSLVDHGPIPVMAEDHEQREQRASGGAVGKRDYPAKRLTRMERAVKRAQDAISLETKPLMEQPDHLIAHALEISKATTSL